MSAQGKLALSASATATTGPLAKGAGTGCGDAHNAVRRPVERLLLSLCSFGVGSPDHDHRRGNSSITHAFKKCYGQSCCSSLRRSPMPCMRYQSLSPDGSLCVRQIYLKAAPCTRLGVRQQTANATPTSVNNHDGTQDCVAVHDMQIAQHPPLTCCGSHATILR